MAKKLDGYLPKDLTAERNCLASVLLEPGCLNGEFPEAQDFIDPQHQAIASLIHLARERGMEATAESIYCLADQKKLHDKIGGEQYLVSLMASVPHGGHAKHYAALIITKAV